MENPSHTNQITVTVSEKKAITVGEIPVELIDLTMTLDEMANGNNTLVNVLIWSPPVVEEQYLNFVRSVQNEVRRMKHQVGIQYKSLKAVA